MTLESILFALAEPARLQIVKNLTAGGCPMNCSAAAPEAMAKSSTSHHFQVLREAGLVRSERRGTEVVNTLRCAEVEARFPGLLSTILEAAARQGER
jgi:DNA-binding transcriptional ArsR family regulator